MEPDDLLCSRNARPQKGLAQRPQSKASHTLARLGGELGESKRLRAQSWVTSGLLLEKRAEEVFLWSGSKRLSSRTWMEPSIPKR
jgi:hypothetical protein